MEICPFCGRQLISCGCCYEKLNVDVSEGTWAYEHGLTDKQQVEWELMLEEKGLIPYVAPVVMCALCGKLYPDLFMVPDEEWEKYIIPPLQGEVICLKCYHKQVKIFPKGWRNARTR
jgi:hypothetical protein